MVRMNREHQFLSSCLFCKVFTEVMKRVEIK